MQNKTKTKAQVLNHKIKIQMIIRSIFVQATKFNFK